MSNDSGCQDIATDVDGDGEYNTIALQTFKNNQRSSVDSTYNHITIGTKGQIAIDNTYAHIPNAATGFDNTYSHMSTVNNRHEQEYVDEPDDATYNHLGETFSQTFLSHGNGHGYLTGKTNNSQTDDTYSHINAKYANSQNKTRTDYEDVTYNHLGEIPNVSKSVPYSPGDMPEQISNGANAHTKGRYSYAVVNKRPRAAKPALQPDDAPHGYFDLEPGTETTGKTKPYNYAFVNKMSLAHETSSTPKDGPHEYYVLEPTQPKATKPKPYDYAVVNKQSEVPKTTLANKDGPHEFFIVEPCQSKATKTKPYDYAVVNKK